MDTHNFLSCEIPALFIQTIRKMQPKHPIAHTVRIERILGKSQIVTGSYHCE